MRLGAEDEVFWFVLRKVVSRNCRVARVGSTAQRSFPACGSTPRRSFPATRDASGPWSTAVRDA